MIEFATLYLGLALGLNPVQVLVSEDVAAVELRLDGQLLDRLHGPDWSGEVDLGPELLPRHFEAIALERSGKEVARTHQWLNLPQDPAVARLVLAGDDQERSARLSWESLAGAEPEAIRLTFDGRPLEVEDPRQFALPAHDPAQLHFLRAELDFANNVTSVAELTFGGTYADRVSTELTAVPILVKTKKPPTLEKLRGVFTVRGQASEVVAVERGIAEVVAVVDRSFPAGFRELRYQQARFQRRNRFSRPSAPPSKGMLKADQRVRFVFPVAEHQQAVSGSYKLFPPSPEFRASDTGLYPLLTSMRPLPGDQRLADALAVAGLTAAGHRRRRVVLLTLGEQPADTSQLSMVAARRYLETLRVPLAIWSLDVDAAAAAGWGETVDASSMSRIDDALRDLRRQLDRQWIVWLDGIHLPQEIELTDAAQGFELVQ